jgi:anti-sigma factor RsiW
MSTDRDANRVVRLRPPTHDEAQRLLPWLVTGRLDDDERARVQSHLAGCAQCQAELDWERRLQSRYAETGGEADAERGLAALRDQLTPQPRTPLAAVAERPRRWWSALRSAAPALRGVIALQAAAIAALAVGLMVTVAPARDSYRTLSSPAPTAAAQAVVRFRPEATDAAIRQALQSSGARLVDGPTVSGAYLLRLPADRDAALKRLRADPAVLLAESLQ